MAAPLLFNKINDRLPGKARSEFVLGALRVVTRSLCSVTLLR